VNSPSVGWIGALDSATIAATDHADQGRRNVAGRWRYARALAIGAALAANAPAGAQQFVDQGFSVETIATLPAYQPLGITFAADGRAFIWQDNGLVRVFRPGTGLLPTPFIDLRGRVNTLNDRGLLGFALDPDFASNGYAYLLYVHESEGRADDRAARTSRLTRVRAATPTGDVADPASETVLLGSIGAAPCARYPASADCIGIEADSHAIGTVRFAPDGTLFVSSGDGAEYASIDALALRSQDLNSLNGKILRIRRDGTAPADNPFYDGTNSNRSKVYSYGLRNPYRFALSPAGEPYIGDVGWNTWEEISAGRGANFGWPCFEGPVRNAAYAAAFDLCRTLPENAVTRPLYWYPHAASNAIVMGTFYTAAQFPDAYRGNLFFADYPTGTIYRARLDAAGRIVEVLTFATQVPGPVSIEQGPEGSLYLVSLPSGEIRRISAQGAPVAAAGATPTFGRSPLTVQFSSAGSRAADGSAIVYRWDFGDGRFSTQPNPRTTYRTSARVQYVATLTVTDGQGRTATDSVTISLNGTPPSATIDAPLAGARVPENAIVAVAASAFDPDETLPASAYRWQVLLHHEDHVHPYATFTGPTGSFVAAGHGNGQERFYYEVVLTVTDSTGLAVERSVRVDLEPVNATPLPAPWRAADVGGPTRAGSASFVGAELRVNAGGRDIWDQADAFHFVHQPAAARQVVLARVASLAPTDAWAKAGVMIRESLAADAAHAMVIVSAGSGIAFQRRTARGALSTHTPGPRLGAPAWVRLTRDGDRVTAAWSADGSQWLDFGADTVALGGAALAGIAVTAHDDALLTSATLDSIRVDVGAGPGPGPAPVPVYVSDLPITAVANGWGPFERDRSNGELGASDGRPLRIAGVGYTKGLGVHAPSDLRVRLNGAYARFRAALGVDDETSGNGSVVFEVLGDGRSLYRSDVRRGGQAALPMDVDVTGVGELALVVTDGGENNWFDHANWADAQLVAPAAPGITGVAPTVQWRVVP
jgi:glucose/arabinose dehydrogenase